jgi:hypothetical protein
MAIFLDQDSINWPASDWDTILALPMRLAAAKETTPGPAMK